MSDPAANETRAMPLILHPFISEGWMTVVALNVPLASTRIGAGIGLDM
jgi:hypothetical protein